MARRNWLARTGTGLNKFKDLITGTIFQFVNWPDTVDQNGTPFAAEYMNEFVQFEDLGTGLTHDGTTVTAQPAINAASADATAKANAAEAAAKAASRPITWTPSAADVGAVPTSRTVNGKALSSNITLSASDVGAETPSGAQVKANSAAAASVPLTQKGAANGVATLGSDGLIPASQLATRKMSSYAEAVWSETIAASGVIDKTIIINTSNYSEIRISFQSQPTFTTADIRFIKLLDNTLMRIVRGTNYDRWAVWRPEQLGGTYIGYVNNKTYAEYALGSNDSNFINLIGIDVLDANLIFHFQNVFSNSSSMNTQVMVEVYKR